MIHLKFILSGFLSVLAGTLVVAILCIPAALSKIYNHDGFLAIYVVGFVLIVSYFIGITNHAQKEIKKLEREYRESLK